MVDEHACAKRCFLGRVVCALVPDLPNFSTAFLPRPRSISQGCHREGELFTFDRKDPANYEYAPSTVVMTCWPYNLTH